MQNMALKQRFSKDHSRAQHVNNVAGKSSKAKPKFSKLNGTTNKGSALSDVFTGRMVLILFIACLVGILNSAHVSSMFENDRFFSHLSDMEREMTFRTEMGLYYSYYKTIIEAPSFIDGLLSTMRDNITEFPDTINVLKRFNLYPEVFLGLGFRSFDSITKWMGIATKQCFRVNRGHDLPPVANCEGIGDPAYFYISAIFFEQGVMMALFFLFGVYLSNDILGGILTVMAVFFNHGECTRVQWTPPLRESFAYPVFVLEMLLVTYCLRSAESNWKHVTAIASAIVAFMLPWQFAQFALMTQIVAVFGTYTFGYIDTQKMKCILKAHTLGLFISFVFLFGNEMLFTSFYAAALLSIWVVIMLEAVFKKLPHFILIFIGQVSLLLVGTLGFKFLLARLLSVTDDAHIGNLFKSKFTGYKDFHTMLYTCAAEFDFLEFKTVSKLTYTLLIPSAIIVIIAVLYHLVVLEYNIWQTCISKEKDEDSSKETLLPPITRPKPHAELLYHIFQLGAFTIMAFIIMRLKLFFTPHLCLMCSLFASKQLFGFIGSRTQHYSFVVMLIFLMGISGISQLQSQWDIKGEFSNAPQEELLNWIMASTPKDAVFAGPMPTMASAKLSTGRCIVNHPHYEDAGLR
ncbi:probable C-mannosyltransferase DPY19L1 [Anneissia japonica]|uniref:probable C-mannosyltransferase DPY19L1 n=1 Tax=Anneissia japonica TaxID=1529436 RepID=UPI001425A402|nr:probable C-mannosyltransferase DPY19L1 [Anneissia japonica]